VGEGVRLITNLFKIFGDWDFSLVDSIGRSKGLTSTWNKILLFKSNNTYYFALGIETITFS
jgi:hypothetical protein